MKRNRQRQAAKQRRADRKHRARELAQRLAETMGQVDRQLLEQMAGNDDDAKLARHRFIFGQFVGAPECPSGISHPELQAAADRELARRRSEMRQVSAG